MTNYQYAPKLRPPSFCTLPDGLQWTYVAVPLSMAHMRPDLPTSDSLHPHGIIETTRRLTSDEVHAFDLKAL